MAESKRDYYEVLGVDKNADDWQKSIIRIQILIILRLKRSLRRPVKPIQC